MNPVLMGVIKLENRLHENQQSKTLDFTPKSIGVLFLEFFIDLKSKGFPFYKRILDLGSMGLLKNQEPTKNVCYIPQFHQIFLNSLKWNKRFYQILEKKLGPGPEVLFES
jgi:hypothetical protein